MLSASYSQSALTASGNVDSSAVGYLTGTIGGGFGAATIQVSLIKVANTGTTVAGYAILQGSLDGTTFTNCESWKKTNYGSTPANVWGVDTFTLANVTTAQPYTWIPSTYNNVTHPYLYYRVKIVMTTCTVTPTGYYIFRKAN